MFQVLLFIFACGVIPGFFLLLCGLLASWLALGQTPLAIRVPLFLFASFPLGLVVCLIESGGNDAGFPLSCLAVAALSAAVLERRFLIVSAIFFVMGVSGPVFDFFDGHLNSSTLTSMTLALCGLAGLISLMRLFGFRLIGFATDSTSRDIELATGRDINEWITILDQQGAGGWTYADTVIFLRDYGFSYHWQKAITILYEKSLGRRGVERSFDGKTRTIARDSESTTQDWIGTVAQHRFSIGQLFMWSVAAAFLFGFFRVFPRFELSGDDVVAGLYAILAIAVVTVMLLHVCLTVRPHYRSRLVRLFVGLVIMMIAATVPSAIGFFPGNRLWFVFIFSAVLGYACWLSGALLLVRQQGFRLVRLQPQREAP